MHPVAVASVAIALFCANADAQSPALKLDCTDYLFGPRLLSVNTPPDSEAAALRLAPLGASRVSKMRLTVTWKGGTRVFDDSGQVAGYMDGVGYKYCGYSAAAGYHLIYRHDNDKARGVLLKDATGTLLPSGDWVIFAPNLKQYFGGGWADGLDGEEWFVFAIDGKLLWKGVDHISAMHPTAGYSYGIADLDDPRWSPANELQATMKCNFDSRPHRTETVTLRRTSDTSFAWAPAVPCPPAR